MPGTMTYVGFDVHARSAHAAAIDVMTGELTRMRFGAGVDAPVEWLTTLSGPVRACYEAGPTGYGLYRAAVAAGVEMEVIAPGLTPRGKGDRVKTDRKDAELLARCLIAGSLTPVVVPSPQVEAAREVTRAHDACRRDLMNARHRVSKMLLRHGRVYPEPSTWTQKHRRWLSAQQFPEPMSAFTFADLIATVDGLTARKKALSERIGVLATDPAWWPIVARLRAFRGVDTLTALAIHLELGADWQRFEKAPRVGSWLGLTPSRSQSGEHDRQGAITKTGSMLARRLLVESAWQYIREPRIGVTLRNRQDGQPDHILQISNRCQHRLHQLYTSMRARGKPHNVTIVALARELSCFMWAAATAP
jgi:transposase